jgi:uncharacterized protein (TIGR01777 family)
VRVLVAGSSGFLGAALVTRLRSGGHEVRRLVRRPATAPDEHRWDPDRGDVDPAALHAVDAVVNLTGSPLGTHLGPMRLPVRPWTPRYRRVFRASRVDATATLARAIAAASPRPPVFLAGSAVGWYGDTGDRLTDEQAPPGATYFAETTQDWEAAAVPAQAAGVRVVWLRTGAPLHRSGGLLAPLLLAFRLGLGGRIGSGRQWQPCLSLVDWLAAVEFLLARDDLAGPVNLVGPAPATNAEFTRALARLLRRPAVLPIPAPLLRILLGEFGRDALTNHRVVPGVLTAAGFRFAHPDLDSALGAALAPLP